MPESFKSYFCDTQFDKIDIDKNKQFIISRLFCYGDINSVKWIKNIYPRNVIIECIKKTRNLNNVIANFLSNVYRIDKQDMNYYIN